MHRPSVVVSVLVVVGAVLAGTVPPAAAEDPSTVSYRAPSDAPVVDRFRPPERPWLRGNRGIDYGTDPGDEVRAAADGEVVFAGDVGGALHVTVAHADGLRTSYSFVAELRVAVGQRVRGGQVVSVAAGPVHFGVRAPDDTYLDPEALLAGTLRPHVRLVPGTEEGVDALRERRDLWDAVLGTGVAAIAHVARTGGELGELALHYALELNPATRLVRGAVAVVDYVQLLLDCTPAGVAPPAPGERRIAIVVSGLGTTSDGNSAWGIDTDALGYDPEDVVRFSYRGGQAPSAAREDDGPSTPLDGLRVTEFAAADSQQDLELSADRLADLVGEVARLQPDVPIDVIGHSQGGVVGFNGVVRAGAGGRLPDGVENVVTIGSPHQGAPLATGVVALQHSSTGEHQLELLRELELDPIKGLDERREAIPQLAETSDVLAAMRDAAVPDGVRVTAIRGSSDLVVPGGAGRSRQADRNVQLLTGFSRDTHGDLADDPAVTREIALAVAGAPPTCQAPQTAAAAFLEGEALQTGETLAALDLAGGDLVADVVSGRLVPVAPR